MNKHQKIMQKEWSLNSMRYQNPIGMTGRRPIEEEFEIIVEDVRTKLGLRDTTINSFLDVGSSNGYLVKKLKLDSKRVVGVDFCFEPLKQGKKLNSRMQFIQGEIQKLPLKSDSFDRVICYSLFHYLPSMNDACLAALELFRVLRPGGRLLIGDLLASEYRSLVPEDDVKRWSSKERPFMHRIENWTFVSIKDLKNHLARHGAKAIELEPQKQQEGFSSYRYDLIIRK